MIILSKVQKFTVLQQMRRLGLTESISEWTDTEIDFAFEILVHEEEIKLLKKRISTMSKYGVFSPFELYIEERDSIDEKLNNLPKISLWEKESSHTEQYSLSAFILASLQGQ